MWGELEVRDEGGALGVCGEVVAFQHRRPELSGLFRSLSRRLGSDGVHEVFDGDGVVCFLGWRREDDLVGGFDGAAAVDEFGVDAAVFGGAEGGQADVLSGFAVVGGE